MPLIAIKPFLDGQGRLIAVGETLPTGYDAATLAHYDRLGMTAEAKATRTTRKTAAAKDSLAAEAADQAEQAAETQAEASAEAADQADQAE